MSLTNDSEMENEVNILEQENDWKYSETSWKNIIFWKCCYRFFLQLLYFTPRVNQIFQIPFHTKFCWQFWGSRFQPPQSSTQQQDFCELVVITTIPKINCSRSHSETKASNLVYYFSHSLSGSNNDNESKRANDKIDKFIFNAKQQHRLFVFRNNLLAFNSRSLFSNLTLPTIFLSDVKIHCFVFSYTLRARSQYIILQVDKFQEDINYFSITDRINTKTFSFSLESDGEEEKVGRYRKN